MSVEIEKTALWADIRKVFSEDSKPVRFRYSMTIHTEKEDIEVIKLSNLDIVRDYVGNIGDEVHISAMMALGDYSVRVFPYRHNLEVTLVKKHLYEHGNRVNTTQKPVIQRYKALFLPNQNLMPKASEIDQIDRLTQNLMDTVDIKLQLIDRALEPLRIKTVNGVFNGVGQADLIRAVLGGESAKITVDGKPAIDGLDLVDPDNTESKGHLIVPTGTLVTGFPTYLQEKFNGVYTTGIGTYLQIYEEKRLWFVYPLYNVTRFDKDKKPKAIFYMVPENRYSNVERTYRQASDITHILITGSKNYQDAGEVDQMDAGNGFRMADARSMMGKPVNMTSDGPTGTAAKTSHAVITHDRKDNLNYAPVVSNSISSNPYYQYSKLAVRLVSRVDMVWENANPDLLYPGMPCKYMYLEGNDVREVKAVVAFVHVIVQSTDPGIAVPGYSTKCMVTLLAEKIDLSEKQKNLPKEDNEAGKNKMPGQSNPVPKSNTFSGQLA